MTSPMFYICRIRDFAVAAEAQNLTAARELAHDLLAHGTERAYAIITAGGTGVETVRRASEEQAQ